MSAEEKKGEPDSDRKEKKKKRGIGAKKGQQRYLLLGQGGGEKGNSEPEKEKNRSSKKKERNREEKKLGLRFDPSVARSREKKEEVLPIGGEENRGEKPKRRVGTTSKSSSSK